MTFVDALWDRIEALCAVALACTTLIMASLMAVSYLGGGVVVVHTTRFGFLEVFGDWLAVFLCLLIAGFTFVKKR